MLKKLSQALSRLSAGPLGAGSTDTAAADRPPSLQAAAVILIEAAAMDGQIDDLERAAVADLLRQRFGLDETAAQAAVATAEAQQRQAVDIYQPLRDLKNVLSPQERLEILVMLWRVVLADGHEDHLETNLMRRAAGLLYVSDQENGRARKIAISLTQEEKPGP